MKNNNVYATPESTMKEPVISIKWYIKLARLLCYCFILLWVVAMVFPVLGSTGNIQTNTAYFVGSVLGALVVGGLFIWPLISFLKASKIISAGNFYRVTAYNMFAALLVISLFIFMVFSADKEMKGIYIFCAIICSAPYIFNSLISFKKFRN
jgi:hypothetical protein